MRPSAYNVWATYEGCRYVYNGMSGALLALPNDVAAIVEEGFDADRLRDHPLLDSLISAGVLIPDEMDEISVLKARFEAGKSFPGHMAMTIISSLGCNFDCPYCYEEKRPELLTAGVESAILSFVNYKIQHGLKRLKVHWLGGEPLLGRKKLLSLSASLRSICNNVGAEYSSYVTTNGYLLTKPVAQELVESGILRAQVTLDGPPATHDRMRPTRRGGGTFERILQNIIDVTDIIPIVVRINVDKENFSAIDELLDILAAHGLAGKIEIYVGHLVGVNDGANQPSASYKAQCFTTREFSSTEKYFNDAAIQRGFTSRVLDGPILTPCMAMRSSEYVVGSKGELYKCWKSVGNRSEVVGNIVEFQNPNSRVRRWLGYDPFSDAECLRCVALPVCMGGCAHHAMDQNLFDDRCTTYRYHHEERVTQFIEHRQRHLANKSA